MILFLARSHFGKGENCAGDRISRRQGCVSKDCTCSNEVEQPGNVRVAGPGGNERLRAVPTLAGFWKCEWGWDEVLELKRGAPGSRISQWWSAICINSVQITVHQLLDNWGYSPSQIINSAYTPSFHLWNTHQNVPVM